MSLHALAHDMATKGRNGDTMLVHMAPSEVAGLHALALSHGEKVTINPVTGLPEMFSLKKVLKAALPMIAGAALNYFAPGIGTAIGGALGLGGAAGAGIAVGGATALATGSLSRGLTAGLGAYGGASLAGSVANAGSGAIAAGDIAAQQAAGTFPTLAEGATQSQIAEYASQVGAARDAALAKAGAAGLGETVSAGLGQMVRNPGMYAGNLLKAGYVAATPMLADESIQTKTKMPSATSSPAFYRPYEFDPETKGLRSLGTVDAAKANATSADRMANGGAVAFADGGLNSLVYKPLSQVDPNAARQGLGGDILNDRQQGLERVLAERGLADEFNQYFVNAGGFGGAYKPVETTLPVNTDTALQNAYYNAVRTDLSEAERQSSASSLLNILKQYEGRTGTPAPSAPPLEITSTAPPEITSTEAVRPTARITPSTLQTQAAAPVPLTSTAPPEITMSAAPTMRSIPVGGGGSAGMATTRPFDYQYAQIEEMPQVQQKAEEDAMTGQSLDAYRRLMGKGAAQLSNNTPQAAPSSSVATPPGLFSRAYAQPTTTTPQMQAIETTSQADRARTATEYAAQEQMRASQAQNKSIESLFDFDQQGLGANWKRLLAADPVKARQLENRLGWGGQYQDEALKEIRRYAMGGTIPGYAMGGLGNLGGYSDGGQLLKGPGDGVSDSIPATIGGKRPARLADGEFVVPARIVSELGNGSTEAGARKLYAMMDRVQRARGKTTGKKRVAANTRAEQYLPA